MIKKKMQESFLRLLFHPLQVPARPGILREGGMQEVSRQSPAEKSLPQEDTRPRLA